MKKKLGFFILALVLLNVVPLQAEARWSTYYTRLFANTSNWSYFTSVHNSRIHYVDIYSTIERTSREGKKQCEKVLSTTGYIYTPKGFTHRKRALNNTTLSCH